MGQGIFVIPGEQKTITKVIETLGNPVAKGIALRLTSSLMQYTPPQLKINRGERRETTVRDRAQMLLCPMLTSPGSYKGQEHPKLFLCTQSSAESYFLCLEGVGTSER